MPNTSIVVVMGVSGSGKTTVGRLLAGRLGWRFVDADSLHSEANVAKMHRGEALTDEDRQPWLHRVRKLVDDSIDSRQASVIACSSLKESYRQLLHGEHDEVRFVYLRASAELLRVRLATRPRHFAGVDLLPSQLATLEEPRDALAVDASLDPSTIVDTIVRALNLPGSQ
jgi:gluconokinase